MLPSTVTYGNGERSMKRIYEASSRWVSPLRLVKPQIRGSLPRLLKTQIPCGMEPQHRTSEANSQYTQLLRPPELTATLSCLNQQTRGLKMQATCKSPTEQLCGAGQSAVSVHKIVSCGVSNDKVHPRLRSSNSKARLRTNLVRQVPTLARMASWSIDVPGCTWTDV